MQFHCVHMSGFQIPFQYISIIVAQTEKKLKEVLTSFVKWTVEIGEKDPD